MGNDNEKKYSRASATTILFSIFFFMVEGKPYAFEDFKEFHDQDQPTSSGFFKKSNFAHQILCASLVMAH